MAVEADAGKLPQRAPRRLRLTRRGVLGAAAMGGVGIAAARLLGLGTLPVAPVVTGAVRGASWPSPLGSESALVRQLLRRATFGAGPAELEKALGDGFQRTLDRLLETPAAPPPPLPGADTASKTAPLRPARLQKWWLDHILSTPTPFAERMTLFWHGHFTSDYRKVGVRSPYLYWQNQTWRANALGDFRKFLYAVTVDPAMLRYLDLATSTGDAPNENYARELMELFTIGPGAFTEDDVRAAARALAGWREPRPGIDPGKTGIFTQRRAYQGGPLTFLGKTGAFDTRAVLQQITSQAATAPFVVGRVLVNFGFPNPQPVTINRLAAGFVKSSWSIKQLMRDVFTSGEFRAASSYRSLVKQPAEFMAHALLALEARGQSARAVQHAAGMGQVLFDPPDVGGWPLNESWISSNTVLTRVNFVSDVLGALPRPPSARNAAVDHLDGVLSSATASLLAASTDDIGRWTAVLASPEFQLK